MGTRQEYSEVFDLVRTLEDRRKKLQAQELEKAYLFRRFMDTAQVVKCFDNIEVPVYLGPGTNGKWMRRGDQLPDAQDSKIAKGYYNNRYLAIPSGIDMIDQWENENNPSALFKLMDFWAMESSLAHFRAMAYAVFSGAGGAQPEGISTIFEKAAPAAQTGTIGGISKSAKSWWRNQYVSLTANFGTIAAGTTLPAGFLALLSLIKQTTIGTLRPSDLVTTQATFENIKRGMLEIGAPQYMLARQKDVDYGVATFAFDGIDIAWDPYCAADTIYSMHLKDTYEPGIQGKTDKTKLAMDFESIANDNIINLDGGLFMIINPNVRSRDLAPRTPYRQLHQTKWMVDSFNLGVFRMSDHGVAGSDNGSRWETWS